MSVDTTNPADYPSLTPFGEGEARKLLALDETDHLIRVLVRMQDKELDSLRAEVETMQEAVAASHYDIKACDCPTCRDFRGSRAKLRAENARLKAQVGGLEHEDERSHGPWCCHGFPGGCSQDTPEETKRVQDRIAALAPEPNSDWPVYGPLRVNLAALPGIAPDGKGTNTFGGETWSSERQLEPEKCATCGHRSKDPEVCHNYGGTGSKPRLCRGCGRTGGHHPDCALRE